MEFVTYVFPCFHPSQPEVDMDGKVDLWEVMAYVLGRKMLGFLLKRPWVLFHPDFCGEMIQFDYFTKIDFQIGLKPSTINYSLVSDWVMMNLWISNPQQKLLIFFQKTSQTDA